VPASLSSVRAKIERAKEHVRDLESRIQSFRNTDPYGVRTEDDPNTGEKVKRIQVRSRIPDAFSLIIGDAVHNLRSALDHLACRLVEANGNGPSTQTAFPVYQTAAEYAAGSVRKVQGMSPAAVNLVEATQPYQAGYADLWALHHLDIIDKHNLLLVAAYSQGRVVIFIPIIDLLNSGLTLRHWGQVTGPIGRQPDGRFPVLEDGAEIGRVPAGQPDVDFQPTFEVAFREPQIVEGKAVLPFLAQLSDLVESIVGLFTPLL
jgi:hypothetical protein